MMKNFVSVASEEVWEYWRRLENRSPSNPLRTDIIDHTFPMATAWFTAEIEQDDVDQMFMIRVPDFATLSKNSWKLQPAAEYFAETYEAGKYDPQHPYNADKMRWLIAWPHRYTSRMIMVSDDQKGPFTLLDGNHRAVLLMHESAIVGASVYVGIHSTMRRFSRAMPSYGMQ